MILYLDTSALVKLYIEESGSTEVEADVTVHSRDLPHDTFVGEIIAALGARLGVAPPREPRR